MSNIALDIINRFNKFKNETERVNFENIWQNASEYCNPPNNNINTVRTAGELKPQDRLIDVGIKSNRIFTSGLSSHLIPAGTKFFKFESSDSKLRRVDPVTRYFSEVTEITYDILNGSNFFQEFTKCLTHLGYIGTSCIISEPSNKGNFINFKSHDINQYYIAEDAFGMVDTVYFELKMTARQIYQLFGEKCSEKIRNDAKTPDKSENEHIIIHAVEPRADFKRGSLNKKDRPISSVYVELDTKNVLKEDGYFEMPYAIGRFYQSNNEKYGRSPALECLSTLSMLNAMEATRIQTAQRVANPPWLSPNDGSVRRISNKSGTIIYWNAGNPASKPEQLIVRDNVIVNDQAIQLKNEEIEDAFFLPLFNPLINRVNMTAHETQQRINIALQNLVPSIGRLTTELLQPLFIRVYNILERQGVYPEKPEELIGSKIQVGFNSKATMAQDQLELQSIYQTMEQVTFLAQADPTIMDNFDVDEIARLTAEANSVPTSILKSEYDVKKKREADAQAQQAQQAQAEVANMAEAYGKTTEAAEAGSAADLLMQQSGL